MKKYMNIYFKELKLQLKTYLITILTFMALGGFLLFLSTGSVLWGHQLNKIIFGGIVIIISFTFLPFFFIGQILFFIYNLKEKYLSITNYLLYSIPARRYTALLIKFSVFTTYLIISIVIMFVWSFAEMGMEIQQMKIVMPISNFTPEQMDIQLGNGILFYVLHHNRFFFVVKLLAGLTFFISGLLLFIKTLRYKLKWFNSFIQTVAALVIFVLFCKYGLIGLNSHNNSFGLLTILSCVVAGTFFLILGLIVYEKHGQI